MVSDGTDETISKATEQFRHDFNLLYRAACRVVRQAEPYREPQTEAERTWHKNWCLIPRRYIEALRDALDGE